MNMNDTFKLNVWEKCFRLRAVTVNVRPNILYWGLKLDSDQTKHEPDELVLKPRLCNVEREREREKMNL